MRCKHNDLLDTWSNLWLHDVHPLLGISTLSSLVMERDYAMIPAYDQDVGSFNHVRSSQTSRSTISKSSQPFCLSWERRKSRNIAEVVPIVCGLLSLESRL